MLHDSKSVNELVQLWRSGDQTAALELHRRYAQRLCAVADRFVSERLRRRVDADDIVQSAFRTFFRRTEKGEYAIDHSGSLWHLLVKITINKARRQQEVHRARKRDVAAEVRLDEDVMHLEAIAGEPSPDEVAALVDELEVILSGLDARDAEMVRLCLEGYSTSEIGQKVGCTRWTVRRVLDRIGHQLRQRLGDEPEHTARGRV